jgi:hypothetical protein
MSSPPNLTRAQFTQALKSGRKFCWATLNERQDFMLALSPTLTKPVREITNEPNHSHRAIGSN